LWFSENGMKETKQLKENVASLQVENTVLKRQNKTLWFQIDRLKNNHDATEEKARNELGMIKKSETFYQFVR
jgi:cell division protein FtsB